MMLSEKPVAPGMPTGLSSVIAFDQASGEVSAFRARVRELIAAEVTPLRSAAERDRKFPPEAVAAFGAAGLFRERWSGGPHGDLGASVVIAEELGYAGLGGVGAGIDLHMEAALPLLRRYADTQYTKTALESALDGRQVCCLATSERTVGSNLAEVQTRLTREADGWRIVGTKWFVSPGAAADVVLVLCKASDGLAIALVPQASVTVVKRLRTMGMRGLETCRLAFDARVPDEAILVRPGMALPALASALAYERLAMAASAIGAMELAVLLATTHLRRRRQFGVPLYEHQALRLRMADLRAQTALARRGVHATVAELATGRAAGMWEAAGVKVTVARLAERVIAECAHLFGGHGYVEDETLFPQLLRDVRIGRIGGGTDEMMWEIVATGLRTDDAVYDTWVWS
jgi:alkylation response protein AidB-like acyl-CoA dehydrogenase